MILGARTGAWEMLKPSKGEEEMYKELFIGMLMDTLPSVCVIPDTVTDIKRQFCFVTSTVTDLTLDGFTTNPTLANSFIYISDQCKIIRTPNLTTCNFNLFQSGNSLEDWYAPKLEGFSGRYSLNNASKAQVNRLHIGKTCDEILSMKNFPWTNMETTRQKLRFVGTDGSIVWDGTSWVKS